MSQANEFFGIFLLTLLVVRIFLYFKPISSPTIAGFRLHHWMYGLVGILLSLLLHSLPLYAISLGMFIDELPFLLMGGKSHKDNYSGLSLLGVAAFSLLVFFLRDFIVSPFL